MVKENGDNCPDGADEKMLSDEEKKIAVKADIGDVKFVNDQQNGDTKVDILEIKQAFTGLTKEELMKYCNDPFWVRLRWAMFILFWLVWFGMLAGAIFIIVGAPKCAPPPPKTWWEEGPLLDLDGSEDVFGKLTTNPAKYFEQVEASLLTLGTFKGMFVPESVNPGLDAYTTLSLSASNVSEFKTFAEKLKEQNINLVVDLTPNYVDISHDWFVKSENGDSQYKDYFVWQDGKSLGAGNLSQPNNWVSTLNEPAWTYSAVRKQFYLHQFSENTPDLNFNNPTVVKEFDSVIKFWIENGASGVRLSKTAHLLVDIDFGNETKTAHTVGPTLNEYAFYTHDKTTNQKGLAEILAHWKAIVQDNTEGQGLLTLKEDLEVLDSFTYNNTVVVDLPRLAVGKARQPSTEHTAKTLQQSLQNVFNLLGASSWPSWQCDSTNESLSSELRFVSMLLPGTPVIAVSKSLMNNNSILLDSEYKNLLALRALPSMKYGQYHSYLVASDTVFAYTRLKSGNPGFMVIYNPTAEGTRVNMTIVSDVPAELTVNLLSKSYDEKDVFIKAKLPADNIPISAKSAIIMTYAPVKD
ncbi:CD98 heavy chain isoform X2 [Arctopsyche grandis]